MPSTEPRSDTDTARQRRAAGAGSGANARATRRDHRALTILALIIAALSVANLLAFVMWSRELPRGGMAMLLFDLDSERNIPTWFSSMLLAYLALLAWHLIPRDADRITRAAYAALAGVFLFLSADEAALLHERFANLVEVTGAFSRARWVLLWLPIAAVVGLALTIGLWKSSRRLVLGLTLGAVLFLTGAVGVETVNTYARHQEAQRLEAQGFMVGTTRRFDRNDDRYGKETWRYTLGTAAEEGLEMLGALTWCAVLLGARRRIPGDPRGAPS